MNFLAKNVLYINLTDKTYEVKTFPDLNKYLGGVGLGLKLYGMHMEEDPIIFSIGPLNGFFPFVSKTSIVADFERVAEDIYIGGSLSSRIAYSGVDSVVIYGKSPEKVIVDILNDTVSFKPDTTDIHSLGLPGKKSVLSVIGDEAILDSYFLPPANFLGAKLKEKNVSSIVVTGTKAFQIDDVARYSELYRDILKRTSDLTVEMGNNPSCSGCPMGCEKSGVGEIGGNIMGHCLVACDYAQKIYSDTNIVFSCLNVLGYDYRHEDIENIPRLVEKVLEDI